jgi:hypothetical protein
MFGISFVGYMVVMRAAPAQKVPLHLGGTVDLTRTLRYGPRFNWTFPAYGLNCLQPRKLIIGLQITELALVDSRTSTAALLSA